MIEDLPPPAYLARPAAPRAWPTLIGFAAGFSGSVALIVWWLT
jgi:hypothetical protein